MRIHLDVNEIGEAKLIECKAELELAKIFLKSGLLRGAAVKVIQAWRAYLSYIASLNANLIRINGVRRVSESIEVDASEFIIATMPIKLMMRVSEMLRSVDPELMELTALALLTYEYWCANSCSNSTGRVIDDELAKGIIAKLLSRIERKINSSLRS